MPTGIEINKILKVVRTQFNEILDEQDENLHVNIEEYKTEVSDELFNLKEKIENIKKSMM